MENRRKKIIATKKPEELLSEHWLDKSKEDLESARIMLEAHRYTWCAFICQQALEKCLKAGYVKKEKKIPPYIHKLERLCQILKLVPPKEILEVIIRIDKYYLVIRYPIYKESVNITDYKTAQGIFQQTRKVYRWLIKELVLQQ